MAFGKALLNLKVAQKGLMLVAIPLVFELLFVSILWSLLYQSEVEVKKEAYARKVNSSTSLMARHMMDFMVGIVGYGFTRTDTFQGHYESAVKDLPKESDNLIAILKDQPVKQAKAIQVKESFTRALRKADDIRIKLEHDEMDQVMLRLPALHEIAQETSSALHELSSDERLLEKESAEAQERLRESVKICLLIGVGLNVIISLLVLAYFSSSITGRLKVMTENSARLAIGQALNCRVGGNDELSELDRAFHDMAASIIALTRRERALVEQAQDVICSLNEDGKFVSVNAAALDLWGYEPDELLGARVGKLLTADDHDLFVVALKDQQNNGTGFPLETRLRRKNGTMGDCLWSAQWSSDEASFVCISHDITERKRNEHLLKLAESRARSIIENIPIGLAICGTNGVMELVNPAIGAMFGLEVSPVGQSLGILFAGKQEEELKSRQTLEFVPGDLIGQIVQCDGRRPDNSRFPIELSCHNIDTVDGDKFMVLVVDLSDKAEIEKLKQEFVMILSHELRTPLTSLQLLLGLLSEGGYGELTERGYTKVSVAERNITRLVKLIQELLDFETIESEKLKMELLPCDLKETLVRAVEASRGPASSKNIELESEFGDLEVVADGDRLIQVVINFIANAVKYSPEGESVLIKSESDGAYALVSVIDRGPGIGKEYCQMIFERFKQVDPAASKGKGNVGLGLAISKAIIDRHGGIIGVNSEVGKGSTFWFRIPIAKSQK